MERVMERRMLLAVLVLLILGVFALSGTASARLVSGKAKPAAEEPICVLHALPSAVESGEFAHHSTVVTPVEVECKAVFAEHKVEFSSHELANRCETGWNYDHSPTRFAGGPTVKGVELDDAGNAEVLLGAGPSCAAGEVLISAHLEEAPYTTVTTGFTILAPRETTPGVTMLGATNEPNQVEDDFDSSFFAVVQVEFPSVYAEQEVEISAEQLYARCHLAPKLEWRYYGRTVGENVRVTLDNDGNALIIVLAEESCASGTSLIEASLVKAPYTTYTTEFTVESPHETI
jgi:hypothetical protein